MNRRPWPALALAAAVAAAGVSLAGCSGSHGSPSAGPPTSGGSTTSTAAEPPKPAATPVEAVLLTTLQDLTVDDAHLSAELGTMKVANDGGATISASAVSGYVNPVVQILTTIHTSLQNTLPTLPANVTASAQALTAAVASALQAFESTNSLDIAGGSGSGLSGASGLINDALGGPLIPDYQSNAAQVTTMEQTTERQFVSQLKADVSTK